MWLEKKFEYFFIGSEHPLYNNIADIPELFGITKSYIDDPLNLKLISLILRPHILVYLCCVSRFVFESFLFSK